jgi:hypothetical protein
MARNIARREPEIQGTRFAGERAATVTRALSKARRIIAEMPAPLRLEIRRSARHGTAVC